MVTGVEGRLLSGYDCQIWGPEHVSPAHHPPPPPTEQRGQCSHLGCQHHCVPTLNGPACYCNTSFQLQADGKTCKGKRAHVHILGFRTCCGVSGLGWGGESLKGARQEVGLPHALQLQGVTVGPNHLLPPDFSKLILKII